MLHFFIFQCPPDETEPRRTLNILSQHLGLPPATLRFCMCHFMKKHRQYSMTIADYILHCKKLDFDDYLLCIEQDAPLDEIAIVIIARMFRFHICILTETQVLDNQQGTQDWLVFTYTRSNWRSGIHFPSSLYYSE